MKIDTTLEDKLKEIIEKSVEVKFDPPLDSKVDITIEVDFTQIKQAFADDKTWHLDLQKFEKDEQPLMTGQEWFDRFEKELRKQGILYTDNSNNVDVAAQVAFVYRKAARKASGVSGDTVS